MAKFDGVIFDLDGTLVDTVEDIGDALNRVLSARRLPVHDYAWYRRTVGSGIRRLVSDALPPDRRVEATITECFDAMLADYGENSLVKTHLYDGVAELLEVLAAHGLQMAVFSNKADELTQRVVASLMGAGMFAAVIGAQEGLPMKPDPTAALLIATRLGLAPSRIAYVGDTGIDMRTATAAGMMAVGVSWGFREREELVENGACAVLDHPLELLELGR